VRPASRTLAAATLAVLAACSGGEPVPAPTVGSASGATVTPTEVPVPRTYGRDDDQAELPYDRLVPAGAEVTGTWFPDSSTVIVTWGVGDDPFLREQGLAVWRRTGSDPPWVATYAFRDPKKEGVLGIQVVTGDVTGDGAADALVFENTGGSGACGTWRVLALSPARDGPTYTKDLCDAWVEISADPVGIRLIESIYGPGDPHCCPSSIRTTTLEWNGTRWQVTSREERDL
jgi:hypothetical protein